ncbi:MAG: twin-arginine translocation signal domain-containing protein [Phycisphaerae bacterium]|nr:twin-arginine translocation signal domain-containing protein [Phycisphaerae bacterium]
MNRHKPSRREFLKRAAAATGCVAAGAISGCGRASRTTVSASSVFIVCDPADPVASSGPAQWSIEQLRASLSARGVGSDVGRRVEQSPAGAVCIVAAGSAAPLAREVLFRAGVSVPDTPESLGLVPWDLAGRSVVLACGSDVRGLVYAILELADRVDHASEPLAALKIPQAIVEQPANKIRSIIRVFASDVEDKSWYGDKTFWPQYLSLLAAQRFNRFALALGLGYDFTSHLRDTYFHFAYPFLVSVPGYNVRVAELPDEERDRNLEMLRFLSDETARRGLHFQLGIWTHAYKWTDSPGVNYTIEGLSPQTHAAYCRAALETLLKACPSISGVTFRIHGESGVAEGSYEFWKTVFEGVVHCGRRVEIDMHAKGMDPAMIELAVATGMPVNISPKYWAEHMGLPYHQAAIRSVELPRQDREDQGFFSKSSGSRSFLRYGYGDLLAENRPYGVLHRMWPGTQRLLLWGDPAMASGYGRASSFCGSSGAELFEPLSFKGRKGSGLPGGRDAYADASLRPARDYEKYLYGYRLWGRLLYNPAAEPETWRRSLRREYGKAAVACEESLAHASRILPLFTTAHTPSAANNNYWPEMYANMPIVDASRPHPYGDTPSPKRFGTVSPLDPQLFAGVDEYANALIEGESVAKYSPVEVAQWMDGLAEAATRRLREAQRQMADRNSPAFRRLAVDVTIQSGLGRFFAAKLRAGVLYAIYDRTGAPKALEEALTAYRTARETWAEMAAAAQNVYVSDVTFGLEKQLRGHWLDRLADIDQDIEDMGRQTANGQAAYSDAVRRFISGLGGHTASERPVVPLVHMVPALFVAGQPMTVELILLSQQTPAPAVRLCYRRVHQAQPYQTADMPREGNRCSATIPGEYTNTPYPLEYYFELRSATGQVWLYPGFDATLTNQPYFVVRQA